MRECYEFYAHDGWFSPEKVFELAAHTHVFGYAIWVNQRGWRKPRNWESGKVSLQAIRPQDAVIHPEQAWKVLSTIMKGGKSGAGLG